MKKTEFCSNCLNDFSADELSWDGLCDNCQFEADCDQAIKDLTKMADLIKRLRKLAGIINTPMNSLQLRKNARSEYKANMVNLVTLQDSTNDFIAEFIVDSGTEQQGPGLFETLGECFDPAGTKEFLDSIKIR